MRLFEMNFLISIILGMAFFTRTKTIFVIWRVNIQLVFIKIQTKMCKRNDLFVAALTSKRTESWKKFLLFLLFVCIFNRVGKSTKICSQLTLPKQHLIIFSKKPAQTARDTWTIPSNRNSCGQVETYSEPMYRRNRRQLCKRLVQGKDPRNSSPKIGTFGEVHFSNRKQTNRSGLLGVSYSFCQIESS